MIRCRAGKSGQRADAVFAAFLMMTCSLDAARELSTDRPDSTESPFTVDAGRLQLEVSAVGYVRDRHTPDRSGTDAETWNFAPFNLRLGLTSRWELQVVGDAYLRQKIVDRTSGRHIRRRGFGDLALRLKYNAWGNDGGTTAFGLMPFVRFPTASDDLGSGSHEGGIVLPFAMEMGSGMSLGAMTVFEIVRNAADTGHEVVWTNTIVLGRELRGNLGGFVELALETGTGKASASFNTGLTYSIGNDLQLDAGVNLGLTRAAPDLGLFAGFARRF